MHEALTSAAQMLGGDKVTIAELLADEACLVLRAGLGWPDAAIGSFRFAIGEGSQSGYTLLTGMPVVVEGWLTEQRFERPAALRKDHMRSGLTVKIEGRSGGPFGVFAIQSAQPRRFSERDVDFLQALANVLADALERQAIEDAIRDRALHDPLTGLPNRVLFVDRLEHALARLGRQQLLCAILFLDLDHFKLVNDSLGHQVGDELLAAARPAPEAGAALERHGSALRRRRVRDLARGHRLRARRDRDRRADRRDLRPAVRARWFRALRDHQHRYRAGPRRRARR
jgi:GAF domain-containing protein